ncbi:hypothetical protein [Edaphocola aurantiacus]|uniref:hypothetical protein n=1 Tax=Edaphocola aurantiacus TaxID=2601682 RepID=UPI001C9464FA|nr:hypothetical protein [Edaphocola aurantiacus]
MNYTKLLLSVLFLWGFAACNKNRNEKSTFYIDGKQYETRKFEAYIKSGVAELVYNDKLDGVDMQVAFGFYLSYFPNTGQFLIKRDKLTGFAATGLILDHKIYLASSHSTSTVLATEEDGLGKYVIEPTWLRIQVPDPADSSKLIEGNDSIRFWGTIYEAKDKSMR